LVSFLSGHTVGSLKLQLIMKLRHANMYV